jgi:hypothetical protein
MAGPEAQPASTTLSSNTDAMRRDDFRSVFMVFLHG